MESCYISTFFHANFRNYFDYLEFQLMRFPFFKFVLFDGKKIQEKNWARTITSNLNL